jgi:hypothetical protein
VTGPKKVDSGSLATAGATRSSSSKMYTKTLMQPLVPMAVRPSFSDVDASWDTPAPPDEGPVAEPPRDRTITISGADADVLLESIPAPAPSGPSDAEVGNARQPFEAFAPEEPAPPAAAQLAAPAPEEPIFNLPEEPTFNLADSDGEVSLDNNPAPTTSGHTLDARPPMANEPTVPGLRARRLRSRRSIALAIATGLGVVALTFTVRALVHRTPASPPSASPVVSATAAPAVSQAPSPPDVPSGAAAAPAPADSAASPPNSQPAPSAPAKHRAPRRRPVAPKSGAAKSTR